MRNLAFANRANADVIDAYYNDWLRQPDSLEPDWRAFFEGFTLAQQLPPPRFKNGKNGHGNGSTDTLARPASREAGTPDAIKQANVIGAIYAYRSIGHTQAHLNPLASEPPVNPRLSMERLGFESADLEDVYYTGNYLKGGPMSVSDLLDRLSTTYCGPIGVEYLHIQETPKRRWLQQCMEEGNNQPRYDREAKLQILRKLFEAEIFERFLHTRYVGQKRFSLEGAETMIPLLEAIIQRSPTTGVHEIVMGMAHRGRLNVLANIVGKSYEFIFREFSENYLPDTAHGDGDVKYHLGYESIRRTADGHEIDVRLASNPSHLEAVNAVVEGKARARQRIRGDLERKKVLPLLIHGDAAFAGQGVVAEVFNMSQLKGYRTGGTFHLVINNQIGFTTDPDEARSSRYCTDVAKMVEVPIFHVNGDDPLAVMHVAEMALDYRQAFGDDVVIDLYCYRRHGHNESDEPGFTQPAMYRTIAKHPKISQRLTDHMIAEGDLTEAEATEIQNEYQKTLNSAFTREKEAEGSSKRKRDQYSGSTAVFQPSYNFRPVKTSVNKSHLEPVANTLTSVPDGFKINPKIKRQLEAKRANFEAGKDIDWAFAEQLAFGTLMHDGTPVRLSGQDSERGTFSQRHCAFYDVETGERYVPLEHLEGDIANFCVHNSSLSEAGVLGFDFGYSLDYPDMLALWEAQFGDFVNGAQVIIDQFITSSESKWQRVSGLVMLLPHGYEGQGPEHSSARLERFLEACAENNIQVCNLTTPAQYFHLLRRQMKRPFRKPLIVMAPKSLLRHKGCVSSVSDFTRGHFEEIIPDAAAPETPKRVICCAGKVYYHLLAYRREHKIKDAAIVRVEQFYPVHEELFKRTLSSVGTKTHFVWCQEEPRNMGAWNFLRDVLENATGIRPAYAGREPAASPAPGSLALHKLEQEALVKQAFTL
ncbi:MAG: 2-oxoglutarate dehydrogenase E1 component [Opitutales bacterium]